MNPRCPMTRPRVTISRMLIAIGFAGIGLAALKSASEPWASAAYTTVLVLLGVGLVGALLRRGRRRTFWVGFAVFGWGYWCLMFVHPSSSVAWGIPVQPDAASAPRLVTTLLLEGLQPLLSRPFAPPVGSEVAVQYGSAGSYWPATLIAVGPGQVQIRWKDYAPGTEEWVARSRLKAAGPDYYLPTGHALWTILAALAGGLIARAAFGGDADGGP